MSTRTLFSLIAVITFIGGVAVLLVPTGFLDPLGLDLDASGIHMARLNGSSALGLAVVLWLAREWKDWNFIRPVAIGTFVAFTVALLVAAVSTMTGVMNSFGWFNVALDGLIALGLAFLLFIKKAA